MTEHDYLIAWGLYAVAALGCLLVTFLMTGWMWRYLKEPLRVLVAVLLFTPTIVEPVKELYAPALAITALDLLFKVGSNVWTALVDLSVYGSCAFVAYAVFVLVRWPIENKRKARQAHEQARQQAAAKEAAEAEQDDQPFTADDRYAPRPAAAAGPGRGRVEPRL